MISHAIQVIRFVMDIGFCILRYLTRDRGYDLLRALASASCEISHETGGEIHYGHWLMHLVISLTTQGERFVTGIGFCILRNLIRDRGYDLLRALASVSCDISHETGGTICYGHCLLVISHARQGVRFVMCIDFCIL